MRTASSTAEERAIRMAAHVDHTIQTGLELSEAFQKMSEIMQELAKAVSPLLVGVHGLDGYPHLRRYAYVGYRRKRKARRGGRKP